MRIIMICSILLCLTYQVSASNSMVYAEKQSLHSKAFDSQRDFYVHLPESYHSNKQKKYPVLYVLYGQSGTLGAVASIEAISMDIPELIVVGVLSKGKEMRPVILEGGETNNKGKSFRNFLLSELLPHIKQTYRVANFSILLGHSNAGRFVLNSLLDDPGKFNAYFASSPSIEDNLINDRVKQEELDFEANNTRLIITLANEGEHMQKPYKELVALFSKSDKSNSLFHHKEYPEQTHGSSYLVSQLYSLRTLFKGWRPSWEIKTKGLSSLQKHNQQLAVRFGFETEIPPVHLLQMSFVFSRWESEEGDKKAEEVVAYGLKNYPNIADRFFGMVEELTNNGFKQPSKNLYQLLCKKLGEHSKCK